MHSNGDVSQRKEWRKKKSISLFDVKLFQRQKCGVLNFQSVRIGIVCVSFGPMKVNVIKIVYGCLRIAGTVVLNAIINVTRFAHHHQL